MSLLQKKLAITLPDQAEKIKNLCKSYGDKAISEVTLSQVFGGMRGVKCIPCDTSEVPPDKGLVIRGMPIKDLKEKLPEEIFWLLLTGERPSKEELEDLMNDFNSRARVPDYVWQMLDAMPESSHPMVMFNTAILIMELESEFAKKYSDGINKSDYWIPTLEDALNIIAKLPSIAAYVYRKRFGKGERIEPVDGYDLSRNYVHMLGLGGDDEKFTKLMRLYLTLHSDHEGGNVSAFTSSTINSALSSLYYSLSGGLNGLAGPLHGLANQECLHWVLKVMEKFHGTPTHEELEKYAWETLQSGKVIPGYGHAVLRVCDPRFEAFLEFGKEYMPNDPVFKTVQNVFEVVPNVLKQVKKISDPWPNVDAGSGALLYHFGLTEVSYYTVLFSVSRAIGICAQAVLNRGYNLPIIRPKSLPSEKFAASLKASL